MYTFKIIFFFQTQKEINMPLVDGYNLQCTLSLKETISATDHAADKIISFDLFIALLWTVVYLELKKNTAENHV